MTKASSTKNQKKEDEETQIFNLAHSLLEKIYNKFTIDPTVNDKPDKAIYLSKSPPRHGKRRSKPVKVGIEITTADPPGYLSYMNERKKDKETITAQIDEVMESGIAPTQAMKKIGNKIYKDWIFEGIRNKSEKFQSYANGDYDEIILICYSDVIDIDSHIFKGGLKDWTNYLLSSSKFPFDKVLFIGADNICTQIYDRIEGQKPEPMEYEYEGSVITSISYGFVPVSTTFNIKNAGSGEPTIKPHTQVVERSRKPDEA